VSCNALLILALVLGGDVVNELGKELERRESKR
jgi:hypothetical protein